jgi:hypothetical protein
MHHHDGRLLFDFEVDFAGLDATCGQVDVPRGQITDRIDDGWRFDDCVGRIGYSFR